jgi:dihydroflavonol-4-reductase
MDCKSVVALLKENYPEYSLPTTKLNCKIGDALVKASSYFQDAGTGSYLRTNIGRMALFDNKKIREGLGLEFKELHTTILDTAKDLIAKGHVPPPKNKGDKKKV